MIRCRARMQLNRVIRRIVGSGIALIPGSSRRVFTSIFDYGLWGDDETVSGDGSTISQTEGVRAELPDLLRRYNVRTLLDAPCGDFHWMKELRLVENGAIQRYIGVDVVQPIIARNNKRFAIPGRRDFFASDLAEGPLPKVDMIFCRDCLV